MEALSFSISAMTYVQASDITDPALLTHQQRLESYKQEVNSRKIAAYRALRQPDARGYSGTAESEYKKELGRHLIKSGQSAVSSQTDRHIAGKLKAAGFNDQQIRQAIQKHSPTAVKPNQRQSQDYAAGVVNNASQVRRQGIHPAVERRLNKVGLAENTGLSQKQQAAVNRWKVTQEYAKKKGSNHPFTQAQKFRLLKAQQLDKYGAKVATNPRADIKAAKDMSRAYLDSIPENKKFSNAIGRNSASVVANKPVKTREAYGSGMAKKASSSGGDPRKPNQRTYEQAVAYHHMKGRSR